MKQKISRLEKGLEDTVALLNGNYSNSFSTWKFSIERLLETVFGQNSSELKNFKRKTFSHPIKTVTQGLNTDPNEAYYRRLDEEAKNDDLRNTQQLLAMYIDELKEQESHSSTNAKEEEEVKAPKIFISHSSKDKDIIDELVLLLQSIGVKEDDIFYTSIQALGVGLGENIFERIKQEINNNTLVLFLLSENFYDSPVCLCEMGATWVLSKKSIPILVPPFAYTDMQGVITSQTNAMKIVDADNLNKLKLEVKRFMAISDTMTRLWENRRNSFIQHVTLLLNNTK